MKIPIHDRVSVLRGEKPTRFPYCNCLLVEDKTRTLIETGTELNVLQESAPESVDLVLNSHAHLDHMHGNWSFPNSQIGFHTSEAPLAQSKEKFASAFLLGSWSKIMAVPLNIMIQFDRPQDALIFKDSVILQFPASRVDFTFSEGDELDLGKVKLRVLHTPGHCGGHCCFYWEREGILFSSDIDFTEGGPWYGNESADVDEFIASVRRMVELSPRITVPGHGRIIEGPLDEPAATFIDHFYHREEKILQMLDRPRTLDELGELNMFHESRIHPIFYYWDKMMIFKHLARLMRLGEVTEKENHYFRTHK